MKNGLLLFLCFWCAYISAETHLYKKDMVNYFEDGEIHKFPYVDEHPRTFTISFPHSGSHFFMYMVQYFSRRIWQVPHKRYFLHLKRLDETLAPYYRCHKCTPTDFFNSRNGYYFPYDANKDKLVLLLRNYKECCFNKDRYKKYQNTPKFKGVLSSWCKQYYDLLACYDQWPSETRFLIRYKDLIFRTEETLREALIFLEVPFDEKEMQKFFEPKNFQFHKKRCMNLMRILNWGPSISKGKSARFHAEYSEPGVLDQIDCHFKKANPDLYQCYLEEYCE